MTNPHPHDQSKAYSVEVEKVGVFGLCGLLFGLLFMSSVYMCG